MDFTPKSIFGSFITKLSQLTNDSGFTTPAAINSTIVPRYAKQHTSTAAAPSSIEITWPAGRFTDVPIMPDPTVVVSDTDYLYKAQVIECTITGCKIKITRQMVSLTIALGTLALNPLVTTPVKVNVFAIQQTD